MSEIDNHIKNTLSEYNPQFDPNDWADMEKLLDKKKKKRALWFCFFGASLLLGAVGTATYFYLTHSFVISSTPTTTIFASASTISRKETLLFQKTKETGIAQSQFPIASEVTDNNVYHSPTDNHNSIKQALSLNTIFSAHETASAKNAITTPTIITNNNLTTSIPNQLNEIDKKNILPTKANQLLSKNTQQILTQVVIESIDTLPLFNYSLTEEETVLSPDTTKRNQEKKKKGILRWYIEANGGMNVPFIKHSSFAKIEPEVNLVLGLQFERIRCFTGFGYSKIHSGFDLNKDHLAIQTNDSSVLMFVNTSQHYLNIPVGISVSLFRNRKVDVSVSLSMINHLKVSNERKGIYKKVDNILLVPNDDNYAIADINTADLSKAYQNNTKENVNEVNQLLNSAILSSQKYYLSGKLSAGFSYKITPFLSWNVDGSYVIDPKLNTFYGNKMGFTGSTGLRYYFK